MPATKNLDGTITVSGTFKLTESSAIALQQAEAQELAGRAVEFIDAKPSDHGTTTFTHTSRWRVRGTS